MLYKYACLHMFTHYVPIVPPLNKYPLHRVPRCKSIEREWSPGTGATIC